MRLRSIKWTPVLVAAAVLALVSLMQIFPRLDVTQQLEWRTYDWRVKQAARFAPPVTTNLAAVFFDDTTAEVVKSGTLGFSYGLYWPRVLYGWMLRELRTEGARVVGFDIMFSELRPDHPAVLEVGNVGGKLQKRRWSSDEYFREQIQFSSNIILAAEQEALPAEFFRTNAWRLADISSIKDADGVLRRLKAYTDYRVWHPLLVEYAAANNLEILRAHRTDTGLVFTNRTGSNTVVSFPIDRNGYFDPRQFAATLLDDTNRAATLPPRDKIFNEQRLWHMGIVLAARELNLDLEHARVDYIHKRITFNSLPGTPPVQRMIPIDDEGFFYIDWAVTYDDGRLTKLKMENLIGRDQARLMGETNIPPLFKDNLVIVGSTTTGNDLTDYVVTPLDKRTYGVSQHWNVANSVILGRFILPASLGTKLLLIIVLGLAAAILTWQLRALWASTWVGLLMVAYTGLALYLYVHARYLAPMVLPIGGALVMTHVSMVTYRVIFEQQERRRVKSVFAKVVAPDVVNELLGAEQLSLGGARRKITIYFADVRGFTEMTDVSQRKAEEYVRAHNLIGAAAEAYYDEQAREVLATVNLYLSVIADTVKKHNGTLDKYIGDCVMAFWGAPTPNEKHALACVRAAIESQRAMYEVNLQRQAENQRREQENLERAKNGQPPLSPLALLSLGTGINTGVVAIGLMGSDATILNYTVFGREVNLASRLEGVSGRGRIIIGEATFAELQRHDPALAATCLEQEPVKPKGFQTPVRIYEVPWRVAQPAPVAPAAAPPAAVPA